MRKEREERKQRYLLNICTYAHKYIHNKIGGILMTVIVLVSVAGPKVVACNYSYFLLLPILCSSCPQQARQQCVVLYLVMPVVQFPSLLWSKTVPQKESSHLQMMARLCQNPKDLYCSSTIGAWQRLQTTSLSATDTSSTIGSAELGDTNGRTA